MDEAALMAAAVSSAVGWWWMLEDAALIAAAVSSAVGSLGWFLSPRVRMGPTAVAKTATTATQRIQVWC